MAEPGDPSNADDHDDLIGFASPASLQGRAREPAADAVEPPATAVDPAPAPEPEVQLAPDIPPEPAPEPDLIATRTIWTSASGQPDPASVEATPEPEPAATEPAPRPVAAASIFEPSPETPMARRRRGATVDLPAGGMGLYAVYALILFAVPTVGVAALVGLLAVTGRSGPDDTLSRSHFIYQQRTLWTAAVVAMAGLILLAAPFALGVPILFLLSLWLVLRGASGVWTLKAGRPIADPRGWWI